MGLKFDDSVINLIVCHKDYNLDKKENLDEIPEQPAVFGLFAIIDDAPISPRYISSTDNLRKAVREVFENPNSTGLKKFMQGSWIKMLCYNLLLDSTEETRKAKEKEWIKKYEPQVTDNGDYR